MIKSRATYGFVELKAEELEMTVFPEDAHLVIDQLQDVIDDLKGLTER